MKLQARRGGSVNLPSNGVAKVDATNKIATVARNIDMVVMLMMIV